MELESDSFKFKLAQDFRYMDGDYSFVSDKAPDKSIKIKNISEMAELIIAMLKGFPVEISLKNESERRFIVPLVNAITELEIKDTDKRNSLKLTWASPDDFVKLSKLMLMFGLTKSTSESHRMIEQGAVGFDKEHKVKEDILVPIDGRDRIIRVGRKYLRINPVFSTKI